MTVLAPDLRDAFGVSNGAIVFIASASAAFFVLGAVPMGYLADRFKRARIVGCREPRVQRRWCSCRASRSARSCCSGPASAPASPRRTRCPCTVRCSPTPTRSRCAARIAATTSMVGRTVSGDQPTARRRHRDCCSGGAGRSCCSASPSPWSACCAFRIKEPPRGQWEKQAVLGEVIEDEEAAPISMEAAFARLMRIRTLRTVVIGFAALGLQPVHRAGSRQRLHGRRARRSTLSERGVVTSIAGFVGLLDPAVARAVLRPHLPPRPERSAADDRPVHRADGDRRTVAVPDARTDLVHDRRGVPEPARRRRPSAW